MWTIDVYYNLQNVIILVCDIIKRKFRHFTITISAATPDYSIIQYTQLFETKNVGLDDDISDT